jgi:hypothetical protein
VRPNALVKDEVAVRVRFTSTTTGRALLRFIR